MDEAYLIALSKMYPWATENTMQSMLEVVSIDAATKKKVLDTIKNQPTDYSEIVDVLRDKSIAIKRISDISIKSIKSMQRDTADIEKMFNTAEDIAWGTAEIADSLEDKLDWTKFSKSRFAKLARIATDVGETALYGIATGVSVASYFSRYALEQEKIVRSMIDFSMVIGDKTQYTNIRDAVNMIGLTENEFLKAAHGFGPIFSNLSGDTYSGSMGMLKLANTISSDERKSLGFAADGVFNNLMNEASSLFKLGEIESLEQSNMKKIVSGFSTSVGISSMLSELTGQERTQYLQNRQETLEDIDFITAFNRSRAYLNETFGEGHSERVRENVALITDLMGMITPELQDASRKTLNRHLYDISLDNNILNNITPDIYKQLALLGSDVQSSYLELMNMAINDNTADVGTISVKFQDFAKLIRQAPPVTFLNQDSEREQARAIQDNAMAMSKSFIDANQSQFYVAQYLDGLIDADDPVRAVDQFRQSLTRIRNTLVPGYNTTGIAIDNFTSGMKFIADAVLGGMPEIPNDGFQTSHTDAYLEQKQMKDRILGQAMAYNDTTTEKGMQNYLSGVKSAINYGNRTDMGQYVSPNFGVNFESIDKLFNQSTSSEQFKPEDVPPAVAAKRIAEALKEFGITEPRAISNILGMISGESNFKLKNEASYSGTSVSRIKKVLASRALFYSDAELEKLKTDDRAFYEAMYGQMQEDRRRAAKDAGERRPDTGTAISDRFIAGGNMGGYAYRGKGYVQLTGEENYRRVGEFLGIDLVGNPDLALDPYHGPRVAAAFYALMSDERKANFTDARKVYTYTWGADPSNGKMDDYARRVSASNNWLAMMNDERWDQINTDLPEVTPSQTETSQVTKIGGEDYIPGNNLSVNQVAAVETQISMGNEIDPTLMEDYRRTIDGNPQSAPNQESTPSVNDTTELGFVSPRPNGVGSTDWDVQYSQTHNTDGTPKNPIVNEEINTDIEPEINEGNSMDSEITRALDDVNSNIQRSNTERESVQ